MVYRPQSHRGREPVAPTRREPVTGEFRLPTRARDFDPDKMADQSAAKARSAAVKLPTFSFLKSGDE